MQSSAETEIVAVDDCTPAVLWTRYWLDAQWYDVFDNIVYQYNKSAIILESTGKASIIKCTKRKNIR